MGEVLGSIPNSSSNLFLRFIFFSFFHGFYGGFSATAKLSHRKQSAKLSFWFRVSRSLKISSYKVEFNMVLLRNVKTYDLLIAGDPNRNSINR